jgi:superfamily I DNA/RNA helicase
MASASSLKELKDLWKIPEKPLSKSFRCNNHIANAVRNISGNSTFTGNGDSGNIHHRPFIIRDTTENYSRSIGDFEKVIEKAGIAKSSSAIICRAHHQLESIRGQSNYTSLKGVTKEIAEAAFARDYRKDYQKPFHVIDSFFKSVADDSDLVKQIEAEPESKLALKAKLTIWSFVKSNNGLPPVSLSGAAWIEQLRKSLSTLLQELGVTNAPNLNQIIKKTGLDASQLNLPLLEEQALFPQIRQETIHQVKGQNIDAVLVLGSVKFWNSVIKSVENNENTEDKRLAYVGMTRARHLLSIALPASHYDTHVGKWKKWGFEEL